MQLFVLTTHCTSKAHCDVCRNLEKGRAWRKSLERLYALPDGNVDFECPYGEPWRGENQAPAVPDRKVSVQLTDSEDSRKKLAEQRKAVVAQRKSCVPCSRNR